MFGQCVARKDTVFIAMTTTSWKMYSYALCKKMLNGEIWISTNNGISHWDKKEQKFDNYDYRDGIPMGNFIEGSACRGVDGTLYFRFIERYLSF